MLKLKPLTINWLAVCAQILPAMFIAQLNNIDSQTCTSIKLLGPCFKTGQKNLYAETVMLAYIPCNSDQEKQDIKHSGNKSNDALMHAARNWININIMLVDTIFLIVA